MITPKAVSFVNAQANHHHLKRIGLSATEWSTDTLIGHKNEYVSYHHPHSPQNGVKAVVVHFYAQAEQTLTAELAPEVLAAARPRRDEPCHYIIDADAYGDGFDEAFDNLTREEDTLTLVDRYVMHAYTEDQQALRRVAIAEHALNDDPPSHLFLYEIAEPGDVEQASEQFGRTIARLCDTIMHYHGDIDIAEGVKKNWEVLAEHDYTVEGQRVVALVGISIAIGAIEALFPTIGVDADVRDRTLGALLEAIDVLDPGDHEEE